MRGTFVALDIETTGLDIERDAIIEIGAVKFRVDFSRRRERRTEAGEESWTSLVDPGRPIPYHVRLLTGITQEEVEGAPSIKEVGRQLLRLVGDATVVGHNVAFDVGFLRRALGPEARSFGRRSIDTFELASILMPHVARYNLDFLADTLGIDSASHHRALPDALMTKGIFLAMFKKAEQLAPGIIREMNRLAAESDWALKGFFREMERLQAHSAFEGTLAQRILGKVDLEEELPGLLFCGERGERPLRPRLERPKKLDMESFEGMLSEGGLLARSFPGYEYRPQQLQVLKAVISTFNDGGHLLVEAGAGTGKSIAYLLPAIHFAKENMCHVVISTNTINLQDQLFKKDIPDLRDILPVEFDYTLLKGRNNYLCRRRYQLLGRGGAMTVETIRALAKILVWLHGTTTGDRAELNLWGEEAVWERVRAEGKNCLGERCPYKQRKGCFLYRARERAETAHIIVVNHALLLSDMLAENGVLPEYNHLIVDEAHHLEEATTKQLSFEIGREEIVGMLEELVQSHRTGPSGGFLAEVMGRLRASSASLAQQQEIQGYIVEVTRGVARGQRNLKAFFDLLALFLMAHGDGQGGYNRAIRLVRGLRAQPAWSDIEIAWDNLSLSLRETEGGLERLYRALTGLTDHGIVDYDDLLLELSSRLQALSEMHAKMNEIVAEPSSQGIYWGEVRNRDGQVSLHSAPLHVGKLLEEHLFRMKETAVLTSATLRVGGSFDYIRERLNLWEARELAVDSPFDYAASTLVYVPVDIPEPNQSYHQRSVEQVLIELCRATKGRSLILFTSRSQLMTTYGAIAELLGREGIAVFGQLVGTSRRQLLENFKTTSRAVLLGTRSFWEGIDVMGEALSCLVIMRLPFPVPTEPIFAARGETFEDSFHQYAVPQAVLTFLQGFGRLIRSRQDRGVVVVLDKRLFSKSYGSIFLKSLPRCTVKRGRASDLPGEAARWIDGKVSYQQGLGF